METPFLRIWNTANTFHGKTVKATNPEGQIQNEHEMLGAAIRNGGKERLPWHQLQIFPLPPSTAKSITGGYYNPPDFFECYNETKEIYWLSEGGEKCTWGDVCGAYFRFSVGSTVNLNSVYQLRHGEEGRKYSYCS